MVESEKLKFVENFTEVFLHLLKVGNFSQLFPLLIGLHDGQVLGGHLLPLLPQDLPSWHPHVEPGRSLPGHLDGQGEEGGH